MSDLANLDSYFQIISASFQLPIESQDSARQFMSRPWDDALSAVHNNETFGSTFVKFPRLERILRDAPFVYPALSEVETSSDPDFFQRTTLLSSWVKNELKDKSPDNLNRLVRELLRCAAAEVFNDPVLLALSAQFVLGRMPEEHEDLRLSLMELSTEIRGNFELMSDRIESIGEESKSPGLALVQSCYDLSEIPSPKRFLGRVTEIKDLVQLLKGGARCVTIHGMAGMGKSTLSLHLARELESYYAAILALDLSAYRGLATISKRISGFLFGPDASALDIDQLEKAIQKAFDPIRRLLVLKDFDRIKLEPAELNRLIKFLNSLPIRATQILVTTASYPTKIMGEVPYPSDESNGLGGLDLSNAVLLCRQYCGSHTVTWDHLSSLSRALDGHPLACCILSSVLSTSGKDAEQFINDVRQRSILSLDPDQEKGRDEGITENLIEALDAIMCKPGNDSVLLFSSAFGSWYSAEDVSGVLGDESVSHDIPKLVEAGILYRKQEPASNRVKDLYRLHPLLAELIWSRTDDKIRKRMIKKISEIIDPD